MLLVPKKVKLNFRTRVKIYVVTGSDFSAPGQLVADALWEDIALNAQGRRNWARQTVHLKEVLEPCLTEDALIRLNLLLLLFSMKSFLTTFHAVWLPILMGIDFALSKTKNWVMKRTSPHSP